MQFSCYTLVTYKSTPDLLIYLFDKEFWFT